MHILTEDSGSRGEMSPLEKGKALLHHMIHHHEQHLEEFVSLKETMEKEGQTKAAKELDRAVDRTKEALQHLQNAYDAVHKGSP